MTPPSAGHRPTLQTIAASIGVSKMTVSLALRNHPRIPVATRAMVQKAAAKLGYRPDPEISKLMLRLRSGRRPAYQAAIGALTTVAEGADNAYMAEIVRSARQRADELGYGFSVFRTEDAPGPRPALQRILRNRGVEGVLILPIAKPRDMASLLDWSPFSVVTTTYGVLSPQFHRVVPHQFGNALEICSQLAGLGFKRIGLVLPAEQDLRVHRGFSAAVVWQGMVGGTQFVPPCIHDGAFPPDAMVRTWFKRHRPDAIVAAGDKECRRIAQQLALRVPGRVAFVSATKAERSVFAGIDERAGEIGSTATELLAAMIHRGEKGVPTVPKVTMVDGLWMEGRSVRPKGGRGSRK